MKNYIIDKVCPQFYVCVVCFWHVVCTIDGGGGWLADCLTAWLAYWLCMLLYCHWHIFHSIRKINLNYLLFIYARLYDVARRSAGALHTPKTLSHHAKHKNFWPGNQIYIRCIFNLHFFLLFHFRFSPLRLNLFKSQTDPFEAKCVYIF